MRVRRWVLLGIWILALTAVSFYGGAVSCGFFFGVTLLPVVSFVYLLAVALRFKVYQEAGSRNMVCGQPMPYFFVLQNEDYFAFTGVSVRMYSDFSYVEELPDQVEYELLPGDRFTFETRLVCRYRGEYEVGVRAVVLTDFFRLFRVSVPVPGQIKALVQPKLVRLEELACLGDLQTAARREARADTEPDALVRDYVEGDSLRQIHWKATARERKLKVRVRTGEEKRGIYLFCDTKRYKRDRREYLPLENRLLEAFLALGLFFAGRDMEYTAYYGQGEIVETRVRGMEDFEDFYQSVDRIAFGEEERIGDVLGQAAAGGILWGAQVVFLVLHEPDEDILELTERLSEGGAVVIVYCVTDRALEEAVRQSSVRRRIIVLPVEEELEGRM